MIGYRAGTSVDAEAISAIFREGFTATFGHLYATADLAAFLATKRPDDFAPQLVDSDYAFRIAEVDGRAIGYIKLGPATLPGDKPPATLELHQLYVGKAWHGQGVAAALTDWLFDEARRRGARHLQLSVYVDNHRARRFYQRYGFVEVGKYEFMVGAHIDDDRILQVAL